MDSILLKVQIVSRSISTTVLKPNYFSIFYSIAVKEHPVNKTHDLNIPDNVEANWGKGLDSFSDSSEPEDGLQLFFIDRLRLNLPVSFQLVSWCAPQVHGNSFRTSTPTLMMRKKKSPFQTPSGVLSSSLFCCFGGCFSRSSSEVQVDEEESPVYNVSKID
uniref:Uncharacterized protein n=1 Tax=Ditylenchus dipsaci TaxID=166011 RepID=A0A915CQ44_9BILA